MRLPDADSPRVTKKEKVDNQEEGLLWLSTFLNPLFTGIYVTSLILLEYYQLKSTKTMVATETAPIIKSNKPPILC